MSWIIVMTVIATAVAVVLGINFVTPEKKLERRIEHRYAVADAQFLREMSVMLGPSVIGGNKVVAYNNGDEIFPAMLEAIRGAEVSLTFETYVYWSGEVGERFAKALAERSRAGIPVHVTIDWVGSVKMDQALLDLMEEAGVEVERYRPLHWYNLGRMNNRTHRKLLVVDGRIGFTGGVGIADEWQGHAQDPDHWRDMHFRIEGPVVAQFQAAFNDNWIKTTGEVLNGSVYFPPLEPAGDINAHLFIASPAGGSESMHLMYLMAVAAAEHSIDLAASYFVPDKLVMGALLQARERGVRIRVLLPGPHIDSEMVRVSSRAEWGPLLRAGVEIHEYQPTMFHNKLMIIDNELVSLGSTNFDIRSFRLNDEASLNVYDHDFAARMTAVFEQDLEQAKPYTLEQWLARPWRERMAERVLLPIKSQL
ncbi:phospholipase D-like domain-containing protein [Lysobacter sp. GX 14042]|uniref:phospholipase D-like domain-containing protein n=1 Tax=Lysobacter sp. GX 14042 TaxID=2907155 RepID=UPI001F267F2F|nr:phospholipase D-like domain-containing protein [Lysobacter sp. GX 14042]MCE7031530.1 phospholipase D-like domain-containing protein [Lysobacter sp. GX 14042]